MRALLEAWLPRLFPGWVSEQHFLCVPHEGKSDLDKSVPRKLKAWRVPGDRFVILRDTDGANCIDLKQRYVEVCRESGRPDSLVRLVCQELESWYLGDLAALAAAFRIPSIDSPANRKRYGLPDEWKKPSVEVKRLVPSFQKTSGARAMAEQINPQSNGSRSLHAFVNGVRRVTAGMTCMKQEA